MLRGRVGRVVAKWRPLYLSFVCNEIATDSGVLVTSHAVVEPDACHVEVGRGLIQARMAEHVLDVMKRPTGLDKPGARLVPQVVELQIDDP